VVSGSPCSGERLSSHLRQELQAVARLAVVGSNNIDLVAYLPRMPERGETLEATRFEMGPGGKGANQAVAAARLGSQVLMVSKVGDDIFGRNMLANLQEEKIDVSHVRVAPGVPNGIASILVDAAGENMIAIVKGANGHLVPDDIRLAEDALKACQIVLLQLEIPLETVYATIGFCARSGCKVILNPAPAKAELNFRLLRGVDFLIPNRTELAILSGMPTTTREDIMAASRKLLEAGIATVITTLGADGVMLVEKEAALHVPAVPVKTVDTTGAGDAFIGAFAHFYGEGTSAAEAVQLAAQYAALSVTRRGAQKSFATLATFEAFRSALPAKAQKGERLPPPKR
jgi:ribokinase